MHVSGFEICLKSAYAKVLVASSLRGEQDGPEVGLICRIRFLGGVTAADQGRAPATAKCIPNKADQGTKR